jgi:pSer/pThr/pTyr-binding forkhead associated (FHA) protein
MPDLFSAMGDARSMPRGLSVVTSRFLTDEAEARRELVSPVLLVEVPPATGQEFVLGTLAGTAQAGPQSGEPLVFEVRKGDHKSNAFATGITVGRTENNDIVIHDNSISRFHAYFQQDPTSSGWMIVDAESRNGTWLDKMRLAPNKPTPLSDTSHVRFGDIEVVFYMPLTFFQYLQRMTGLEP